MPPREETSGMSAGSFPETAAGNQANCMFQYLLFVISEKDAVFNNFFHNAFTVG